MLPDHRIRQRDYLLEIARAITEELDLDKVLSRILHVALELLSGRAGLIAMRGEGGGWRVASSHGIKPDLLKRIQRLLRDIPDHRDAIRFELPEVNRRLQRITHAASLGLLTGVGLPLITHQDVVGMIFIFRAYQGTFSAEDISLLEGFAVQAAIAVHNARLYTQIAEQKKHMDAVLESSADGIFILDPTFRIRRFNPACTRLTGYDAEEVLGRKHETVIRWLRVESGPTLEKAAADGWPLSPQAALYVEGDLITSTGSAISVGITYAPAISSEKRLLSIVGNIRDITKFREAEELKSTFISIVSHELRTPVALIKGYVGTLRREDAKWDPQVVRESLEVIESESDHLAQLIDDLLDASRLQAGGLSLNFSEVNLQQLAERLAERFRTQSEIHTFVCDFPPHFPLVRGDEERLTQVLTNLLSNAVKYSPNGGQITISGHSTPDMITVCVQDEGRGIASSEVPLIFDRFFRGADASRKTQGAGLGLFLAKAIVEAHDGKIYVDQSAKKGTRICFSMPKLK
jgi:PAS domain S-box-containing protein